MEKDLLKATRMIPCSVVLLTAATGQARDAMTATAMFVSENLPLVTISLSRSSTCRALIDESGECVLNVASVGQASLARKLGSTHGSQVDKFAEFKIPIMKSSQMNAPSISGSYANLECKIITSHRAGNYLVYIAEVVAYGVDEKQVPLVWHENRFFSVEKEVS
ncbi:MAG: flavin reductase family protein [Deltaproteobacteria bacterium]|nr:flavin reductase family protein [Deltaproteobacteria bacterium]